MAVSENKEAVQNFTGGLITDYQELNTPLNISVAEANCDLDRRGYRLRRLGMQYEGGYTQNFTTASIAQMSTNYIGTYDWNNVNNNALLNFLVVQTGNILNFYDKSFVPLSSGILAFSIDLNNYKAPSVTDTSDTGISCASGNGLLFVVGAKINPFYITYAAGVVTTTLINIKIRDLVEQDATASNDARLSSATPGRLYDLFNQGWNTSNIRLYYSTVGPNVYAGTTTVLQYYVRVEKVYPPKTAPWWVGKRIGDKGVEVFDPAQFDSVSSGNTLASLGHFIVDAFNIDRSTVSGIAGLPIQTISDRPSVCIFFAGKVFYALGNTIYYSQTITNTSDLSGVGKCYMEADPTSEQINNLIATDGGTITIPQSATPIAFFVIENSLVLFTSNGTWLISGQTTNSGFSATDYSVNKISDISCSSARTLINADGMPVWWAPQGIYTLSPISTKQSFEVKNIITKKIQNFYDAILPLVKINAAGAYDHIRKRCIWTYASNANASSSTNRFYYNNVLILDLMFDAFIPYTVSDVANSQPSKMCGVFNVQPIQISTASVNVLDAAGNQVVDQYGNFVTISSSSYSNNNTVLSDVKYLVVGPTPVTIPTGTSPLATCFGDFTGTTFHDWTDNGVLGANYVSSLNTFYVISGYMSPHFTPAYDAMMWMYAPYLYVYLENNTRATASQSVTSAYVPTVTSPSIMAYIPTIHTPESVAALYDYANDHFFTWFPNDSISKFDGLQTGAPLLEKSIGSIGVAGLQDSSSASLAMLSNGHMQFVGAASVQNSNVVVDIDTSTLSFITSTGVNGASFATTVQTPYSMCPIKYGSTEGTLVTSLTNALVTFIPQSTFINSSVGTLTEGRGVACQGAVAHDYGTAFILSKLTGSNTSALGLYRALYSGAGVSMSKIGTLSPSGLDATWTHWQVQGLAYDQTDGNVLASASTIDAVGTTAYIFKLSTTNAAVVWKCAINGVDGNADSGMPRSRIQNQRFFFFDAANTLQLINTATGAKTTQTISNLTVTGGQMSDDVSNSVMFYGNWSEGSTHPAYLGTYMGGGIHTLTSRWARWFVGTVAGQTHTTVSTAIDNTNGTSCLLTTAWDWSTSALSKKWAQTVETFRPRTNFATAVSRNKIRGKGKTMQLMFSSTEGKDFQLLGWGIWTTKNQHP